MTWGKVGIFLSYPIFSLDFRPHGSFLQMSNFVLSLCRKYLQQLGDNQDYTFGLKEYATKADVLDLFQGLKDTNINWSTREKRRKYNDGSSSSDDEIIRTDIL